METVFKTTLAPLDEQEIEVPSGADFLCAREQHGQPTVWYRCNPEAPKEKRKIAVCGTGHAWPESQGRRYLGTCFLDGGSLVFHVFEVFQ